MRLFGTFALKISSRYESAIKAKGFTLIELIVGMSVIGILSVLGIAAFVEYSRAQAVANTAQDIVATLNLARSRAQSQYKPMVGSCADSANELKGYYVELTANEYIISARCGLPTDPNGTKADTRRKTTPVGITILPSQNFGFHVLTGAIDMSGVRVKTIEVSDNVRTKAFTVYDDGRIVLN